MFDLPPHTQYRLSRDGDRVMLRFDPERTLGRAPDLPRNVRELTADGSAVTVRVAPGATSHDMRIGDHAVLDVFDPMPATKPEPGRRTDSPKPAVSRQDAAVPSAPAVAARHEPAAGQGTAPRQPAAETSGKAPNAPARPQAPPPAQPVPAAATPDAPAPPTPHRPAANQPAAQPPAATPPATIRAALVSMPTEPQAPAAGDSAIPAGSLGLVATLAPPPAGLRGTAFVLPFPTPVGAAAFQREDTAYVLLDQPRPLDLSALRKDRLLWSASVHLLPAATLIRLRLPPGMTIRLFPAPQGWMVAAVTDAPRPAPITDHAGDGRLTLSAAEPGRVVTLADPETGATLLVGTQIQSGQAVAIRRRGPEFTLLPSWQGVLVEALSERLTLRAAPSGFVLGAEPGKLAISPLDEDARSAAAALTRRFHFPDLPVEMLRQRIARGLEQAAAAPPLARGTLRRSVARDMIALGLAAEAEALLRVAMQEDPKEAASPDSAALAAIAALLAGRPAEADAIADPRLPGSDEITFWRAVQMAAHDAASPEAAARFAVTAPLALDYPPAMRGKLLPLVLETMLHGGQAAAAQALLARGGQPPGLALARAMAEEATGRTDAALRSYDTLAQGADQLAAARAAVRALELRLKLGRVSVQAAADGLDRQLYAWRGDRHDLKVRERLAELRQQSGAWRAALAVLRGAAQDFPANREDVLVRMREVFAALLGGDALDHLPPLDLVTLVEENADLLPVSADGEALQAHLADRLVALDLPRRADPVLEKLVHAAPTAGGRAGFGLRLGAMRLHEGDAAGALQALLASAASGLPPELAEQRLLLFAAATARRGDLSAALAALADLHSALAAAARAEILEQAQDWWGADRALTEYVDRVVPAAGALDDRQRRALLRLATAAARAGDDATLAGLNARESVRMGSGALADMFHLLTAPPVRGSSDLKRARQEAGLARALPADLKALDAAAVPR